jgi:hypothetical protein
MPEAMGNRTLNVAPCPFSRARCGNRAAVHLDHVTDDSQTEAQSAVLACRRTVSLPESIEDIRDELRLNAHAGIRDGNFDVAFGPAQPGFDAPSLARELHCVGQQVPDHLLHPIGIAEDDAIPIIDHHL